jgi:hypothetical protein
LPGTAIDPTALNVYIAKRVAMNALDKNRQRPIHDVEKPGPGGERKPDPAAEGGETGASEPAAVQESKRTVLVTVSDCVCDALARATSVR